MDKTKEADEFALGLIPIISSMSLPVRLRLNAAVTEDREACIRALQTSSSPTRKMRNGNGEQPEAS
jgi:hypothetical protein